jgi:hypothetical protein
MLDLVTRTTIFQDENSQSAGEIYIGPALLLATAADRR